MANFTKDSFSYALRGEMCKPVVAFHRCFFFWRENIAPAKLIVLIVLLAN